MFLKRFNRIVRNCHTKPQIPPEIRNEWKTAIGLEIHAQLATLSKLFSSAPAAFGAPTNGVVSLFDAAIPGTLPCLNRKAVDLAVLTALALQCKINPVSYFDRKHYFYSDLPAGYQISQQRLPIAINGKVDYAVYQPGVHKNPYFKTSYIKQIQLEQDSGKILHEPTENKCYVDLNRAGIALVEIVFQPDVEDEEEASALVKEVIKILQRVNSCSCKMEEGALRVDVNVSVHKPGTKLGTRTEIKNLGSVSSIRNSIQYERKRQIKLLESGEKVINETLEWDDKQNKTKSMRDKEMRQDYRFMPEPNLLPLRLIIDEESENHHKNTKDRNSIVNLSHCKNQLPPLPHEDRNLLMNKYGLSDIHAFNLVNQNELLEYFKEIMREKPSRNPKLVNKILMYNLVRNLNLKKMQLKNCSIPASHLGELVDVLENKQISKLATDLLLEKLLDDNSMSTLELVKKENLHLLSDPMELRKLCVEVFEEEKPTVDLYKKKKNKRSALAQLKTKVNEKSRYCADTEILSKLFVETLDEFCSKKL